MNFVRTLTLPLAAGLAFAALAAAQTATKTYDPRAAFAEADTNRDGHVDYQEFVARITEVYYLNDANKDGSLSNDEARSTMVVTENLLAADGNGDGRLTVHELVRARVQDFGDADRDRDGLLSVDEVVTAYEGKQP